MTRASEQAVRRRVASQSWSNRSATIEHMIGRQGTQAPPYFVFNEEMKDYEGRFITHQGVALPGGPEVSAAYLRSVVPPVELATNDFFTTGRFWEFYQVFLERLGRGNVVAFTPDTPQSDLVFFTHSGEMWFAEAKYRRAEGPATSQWGAGVVTADEPHLGRNWVSSLTPMGPFVRTPEPLAHESGRVLIAGGGRVSLVNIGLESGVELLDSRPETRIVTTNEQRLIGNWGSSLVPVNPVVRTRSPVDYDLDNVLMVGGDQAQVVNIDLGYGAELIDLRPKTQIGTLGESGVVGNWVESSTPMGPLVRTPDSLVYGVGHVFVAGGDQAHLVNVGMGHEVEIAGLGLGTRSVTTRELSLDGQWALYPDVVHHPGWMPDTLDPDVGSNQQPVTPVVTAHIDTLLTELESDFAAEPFEDGMDHEAERTLSKAFVGIKAEYLLPWLSNFCTDLRNPNLAASVLRCLGRLHRPGTEVWRTQLIGDALSKGNAEIRDAAVQAVEQWGETNLASVLRLHQEELPWLQDYIAGVLQDLEG